MFKNLTAHQIIVYLVEAVIIKAIFIQGLATLVRKLFMWGFVRSQDEFKFWLHYKNKAMHRGHHTEPPSKCYDGVCATLERMT